MGYDVGASGAFGILLSEWAGRTTTEYTELGLLFHDFQTAIARAIEVTGVDNDDIYDSPKVPASLLSRHAKLFSKELAKLGIQIPKGASLMPTGNENESPGR